MPKTKISEFSATPANNTDIDSINIAEGCAPSGINDAIRELMAQLKDFQTGAQGDSFNGPVGTTTAAAGAFTTLSATGNVTLGDASTDTLNVGNGGLIKDASGNVGIRTTPSAWGSFYPAIQASPDSGFYIASKANEMGLVSNGVADNSFVWKYTTTGQGSTRYTQDGANQTHKWFYAASGTAGNTITFTQAMTLDSSGNLLVGTTSSSQRFVVANSSGSSMVYVGPSSLTTTGGENAANAMMKFRADATTTRSINAAGTVNAAGLDYAEYMVKSSNFTVAKGDVVGINAQGKLTNVFADSVSFVVKSTNPSYVGGDTWGSEKSLDLTRPELPIQNQATEETEAETDEAFAVRQAQYQTDIAVFESALEAARALVDRIAFSGQVPVNVTGATAGQYIIPVNNNGVIKGQAVSNPTFEQYQTAVGKVIAIESDGRARIIVKVA